MTKMLRLYASTGDDWHEKRYYWTRPELLPALAEQRKKILEEVVRR